MTDIVEWLRGLAQQRRTAFGEPGMAGVRFEEAADEIERLRDMIDNRNEFIAEHGLWRELGQYLSEPHVP